SACSRLSNTAIIVFLGMALLAPVATEVVAGTATPVPVTFEARVLARVAGGRPRRIATRRRHAFLGLRTRSRRAALPRRDPKRASGRRSGPGARWRARSAEPGRHTAA